MKKRSFTEPIQYISDDEVGAKHESIRHGKWIKTTWKKPDGSIFYQQDIDPCQPIITGDTLYTSVPVQKFKELVA